MLVQCTNQKNGSVFCCFMTNLELVSMIWICLSGYVFTEEYSRNNSTLDLRGLRGHAYGPMMIDWHGPIQSQASAEELDSVRFMGPELQ